MPDRTTGESWQQLEERIRSSSPHGSKPGWKLISVIVKSRDDLRQEQFAVQLITLFQQIFKKANLPVWLQPYQVLATSADAGLIQVVNDTVSLHGLKKKLSGGERGAKHTSLSSYFEQRCEPTRGVLARTRENFMLSLAAYSVVCYLLQIKDRHNGNILIDNAGHVVHIDYGFMLSNSPGNIGFEKAAFKLTREMVDVMGGEGGRLFEEFKNMCVMCYLEARKHAHQILMMVEITRAGQPDLPCFTSRTVLEEMQERFKLGLNRKAAASFFESLIHEACLLPYLLLLLVLLLLLLFLLFPCSFPPLTSGQAIDHWCTRQVGACRRFSAPPPSLLRFSSPPHPVLQTFFPLSFSGLQYDKFQWLTNGIMS
ncbi:hypothetical protein GUITHDRAFT_90465 [Guillardia theta CCMP2712]|uniref:1-phosphatidylinositol 4-kinase n=1 Tax=Guillardia theta (strain CCMP2712) TaxID=905079 RepID=L1IEX6_GUITC|nr:hypothetical protein GUITHDRAFT_90465 [Guillardia theta CCMP2712]EKX34474.1 hypothetical protein GUITHDRAFT_90465 [Guillardia theta CCMP2712]|eukprot:XP_005821454.1 hypothetical protein GUITHDRAFT_90465 [Guillardia theta CCMP2712]